MKKSPIASILAIAVAWTCLLGLVGCERNSVDGVPGNRSSGFGMDSGDLESNIGLEVSKILNKSNGKYIHLYVENNGDNSVVTTINGQSERTLQAGEAGSIYLEVTQGLLGHDREYEVKVVPGANGGSINIHYEIDQRDEIEQ